MKISAVNGQFLEAIVLIEAIVHKRIEFAITIIHVQAFIRSPIFSLRVASRGISIETNLLVLLCFNVDDPAIACGIIFCRRIGHDLYLVKLSCTHIS